mmetsp:Transcript_120523/g.384836  ORF Transcript_120523/g.384836 Transcript_120523/m.384836 type:complete len:320 (+) Transcript_120523:639-1598(+)
MLSSMVPRKRVGSSMLRPNIRPRRPSGAAGPNGLRPTPRPPSSKPHRRKAPAPPGSGNLSAPSAAVPWPLHLHQPLGCRGQQPLAVQERVHVHEPILLLPLFHQLDGRQVDVPFSAPATCPPTSEDVNGLLQVAWHSERPDGRPLASRNCHFLRPRLLNGFRSTSALAFIPFSATPFQLAPPGRRSHDRCGSARCPAALLLQLHFGLLLALALALVLAQRREVLLLVSLGVVALRLVPLRLLVPLSPHLLSSMSAFAAIARRRPGKELEADDAAVPSVTTPPLGSVSTGAADGRGFGFFHCTGPANAAACGRQRACHGA